MVMVRALKSQRYATRNLEAGDEFEVTDAVARILRATKKVGDAPQPEPARRGRPPKAAAAPAPEPVAAEPEAPPPDPTQAETEVPEPTHAELMERAEKLDVELPSGYVRKDDLAEMIAEAEKAGDGDS